jgi:uncharacterized membrane protein YczE
MTPEGRRICPTLEKVDMEYVPPHCTRGRSVREWFPARVNRRNRCTRLALDGVDLQSLVPSLPFIAPWPGDRFPRRLVQLLLGLVLYGVSDAMLVLAALGLDPWDVFHQGLARHSPFPIGTWSIVVGAIVLLLWFPLRQRPGLGTVSNVFVIGLVINAVLALVPVPTSLAVRIVTLCAAVLLNGIATGAYIGAGMGPGPRDGLMTGLALRGGSIRVVRTGIELTVLIAGFLLGGTVGIGTLLYALAIGPLVHQFMPMMRIDEPRPSGTTQQKQPSDTGTT